MDLIHWMTGKQEVSGNHFATLPAHVMLNRHGKGDFKSLSYSYYFIAWIPLCILTRDILNVFDNRNSNPPQNIYVVVNNNLSYILHIVLE